MGRQPLGRGLSALLGDEKPRDNVFELGLEQIEPNADQPRTRFSEPELNELAQSIKANGLVQPVVVRRNGSKYQIVAGERRWRAAQKAGLHKIQVVVRDVADDKLLELALIENIQRQELNPVEEARAYRKLIDTVGITQEMVAERVGKERSRITTSLRLLKLPEDILTMVAEGSITAGHARVLLTTDDPAFQRQVAAAVVKTSLSVRETEKMIRTGARRSPQAAVSKGVTQKRDANLISAETKLRRKLGTNVKILPAKGGAGGKLEIEYYTADDLDRIYQVIIQSEG